MGALDLGFQLPTRIIVDGSKTFNGDCTEKKQIRVALADDHAVVRVGIRRLLSKTADICVVGESENGLEALNLVRKYHPDVLLLDMEMPLMNGLEVTERLHKEGSPVRVLILSGYDDTQYVRMVLSAGACGYLSKGENPEAILTAIRSVAKGRSGWAGTQVFSNLGAAQ